jgi:putative MATE family efflux protein
MNEPTGYAVKKRLRYKMCRQATGAGWKADFTMQKNGQNALIDGSSPALAHWPIGKLLFEFSAPAMIATSASAIYNIIDRAFIGHGVGPMAISGLALTLPLMNLGGALGALVGGGAAARVSIRLGEKNTHMANAILGNTVFLNVVFGGVFSLVCLIFLTPILLWTGGSSETLPYALQFMQILLFGNIFTHLYLGLTILMRACGFPRKATAIMLATVAANLLLCPLFIFQLHWGIRGAALATVCAQILGAALAAWHFVSKKNTIHFQWACFRPDLSIIRDIFSVGMSNFTTLACASAVALFYNIGLKRYGGDYAIGAFGIINTLGNLSVMLAAGVTMGMQPIIGYNYGARKFDRVVRAFRLSLITVICITTLGFFLAEVFPRAVARAFTTDTELIRQSVTGMRIAFLMFPIIGLQIVTSFLYQGIGKAKVSVLLSLSRQVLFLIPFLILLPVFFGLNGVWMAGPAADLVAAAVSLLVLKMDFRRTLQQA